MTFVYRFRRQRNCRPADEHSGDEGHARSDGHRDRLRSRLEGSRRGERKKSIVSSSRRLSIRAATLVARIDGKKKEEKRVSHRGVSVVLRRDFREEEPPIVVVVVVGETNDAGSLGTV